MNELDEIRIPVTREAEEIAIGTVLSYPEAADDFMQLTEREFYLPQHRNIYKAVKELYHDNTDIDVLVVHDQLRKNGNKIDLSALNRLKDLGYSGIAINTIYAKILRDYSYRRALIEAGRLFMEQAGDMTRDAQELVQGASSLLEEVSAGGLKPPVQIGKLLKKRLEQYINRTQTKGTPTGLNSLDKQFSGFFDSELTVIAARPSMGKTSLAEKLAEEIAILKDKPVIFFSLEMDEGSLGDRYLSRIIDRNVDLLRRELVPTQYLQDSMDEVSKYEHLPVYIDDSSHMTTFDVMTQARRMKREHGGLGAIFVDFITLLSDEKGRDESTAHQVGQMARRLAKMAKTLKVPVVVLAQLSREVEKRPDKRPVLRDLKESGGIEEAATNVLFIYRDEYYNPDTDQKNIAEIIIAKQKQGPRNVVAYQYYDDTRGKWADKSEMEEPWQQSMGTHMDTVLVPDEWR